MASKGDYARVLLRKAGGDEVAVRKLGSDIDISDEIVGFHAQQAVEKAGRTKPARPRPSLKWATAAIAWARDAIEQREPDSSG